MHIAQFIPNHYGDNAIEHINQKLNNVGSV